MEESGQWGSGQWGSGQWAVGSEAVREHSVFDPRDCENRVKRSAGCEKNIQSQAQFHPPIAHCEVTFNGSVRDRMPKRWMAAVPGNRQETPSDYRAGYDDGNCFRNPARHFGVVSFFQTRRVSFEVAPFDLGATPRSFA